MHFSSYLIKFSFSYHFDCESMMYNRFIRYSIILILFGMILDVTYSRRTLGSQYREEETSPTKDRSTLLTQENGVTNVTSNPGTRKRKYLSKSFEEQTTNKLLENLNKTSNNMEPHHLINSTLFYNVSNRILQNDPCFGKALIGACDYGSINRNFTLVRYTFVPESSLCRRVLYSGCNGDENLFDDSNDCKSACENRLINYLKSDQCQSPFPQGCVAQTPHSQSSSSIRHYFSLSHNRCISFQSADSEKCLSQFFSSPEDCLRTCRPKQATEALLQNKCFATAVVVPVSCPEHQKTQLWFYMSSMRQCLQYRSCPVPMGGNTFLSKSECDDSCLATNIYTVCSLPLDVGLGSDIKIRFFFDSERRKCRLFHYQGSMGNLNRFGTFEECADVCEKVMYAVSSRSSQASALVKPIRSTDYTASSSNDSELSMSTDREYCYDRVRDGACKDVRPLRYVIRYHYDAISRRCVSHRFEGCGGTGRNSFVSLRNCDRICRRRLAGPESSSSVCARQTTWCSNSSWIYWRYNLDRGLCELFPSCTKKTSSDGPLFTEESKCVRTCVPPPPRRKDQFDVCHSPPAVITSSVHCPTPTKRWFYDSNLRACAQSLSCSLDNANNFDSRSSCMQWCEPANVHVTCTRPPDKGPCTENRTVFHFDQQSNRCKPFVYGGCLGNKNRFQSQQECITMCISNSQRTVFHASSVLVATLATVLSYALCRSTQV